MDRQKVIPTFITKNSMFISFSDNGRDNEKVGITMLLKLGLNYLELCSKESSVIKINEYADKTDKEYCGKGV